MIGQLAAIVTFDRRKNAGTIALQPEYGPPDIYDGRNFNRFKHLENRIEVPKSNQCDEGNGAQYKLAKALAPETALDRDGEFVDDGRRVTSPQRSIVSDSSGRKR